MQLFISVQRIRNQRQELILNAVLEFLQQAGIETVMLNRDVTTEAFADPMPHIREALLTCQAAVVIAFTRLDIPISIEYPGATYAVSHAMRRYCSVWSQIETAMAFQAGLPLLVFQDEDLFQQGAVNIRRTSYPVLSLPLDYNQPTLQQFITISLEEWLRDLVGT